ncbi:MAG: alpha-amylase family glycosyl hydrolase [Ignavibacteriaceae bacterium]
MKKLVYLFSLILFSEFSFAQVTITNKDVTAWKREQTITGIVDNSSVTSGILVFNEQNISFQVNNNSFSVPVILEEGTNTIFALADSSGTEISSDTVRITLGYKLKPEVFVFAEVSGRNVNLHTEVIENPTTSVLTFNWVQDENNPSPVSISNLFDSTASFIIPEGSPLGEYYFSLFVIEADGDTAKARTFVTVTADGITPFDIKNDYAAWIDSAVIYEITPYLFVNFRSGFDDITNKIPEIAELGITAIWLQPVYLTHNYGQGYDVTNYFQVRSDLGTEEELRELISTAKAYGLRIIFDFVANHSSINHPYAVSTYPENEGTSSYYYNFYQREEDSAPYSDQYTHYRGFINYFWGDLPNLNYNNSEVQKWITEAAQYWIENFDIDGYRFDAIWGVTARNPQFTKDLRLALKRIKPEILLLAEDKASQAQVFDERFDVAYDWAPGYDWVSEWVWQYNFTEGNNPTIFNSGSVSNRSTRLRNSLNNNGNGYAPDAKILRFLGNNDLFYFMSHHGLERTKMAAALQFSLHGVPLIYNGEEIGKTGHPYETDFIFYPGRPMDYDDNYGLFDYYARLIDIRKTYTSLISDNYEEMQVTPGNSVFAFRRWDNEQNIFTVINMSTNDADVELALPVPELNLDSSKTYYLTDLLTGSSQSGVPADLNTVNISMEGYSTQILLLADSIPIVTGIGEGIATKIPESFELSQNYPNPFNPVTNFEFRIADFGLVTLKIYDILGKEVTTLMNEEKPAGLYNIKFDASDLSSGVYFYKLRSGDNVLVKKMILLK